jgi:hypothetical protein
LYGIMAIGRTGIAVLLTAVSIAGCSGTPKPGPITDPNLFPADYKDQIATYLTTTLTERADFHTSLIAPPALKPVGPSQHYVVCVQLNGFNQHKDKAVIYLNGFINQYVDATPEQCAGAAYVPFKELAAQSPT